MTPKPMSADTMVERRVEELVDAGFATVSRNPSDWEASCAWRHAIRTAVEDVERLEAEKRMLVEAADLAIHWLQRGNDDRAESELRSALERTQCD